MQCQNNETSCGFPKGQLDPLFLDPLFLETVLIPGTNESLV